MSSIPTCLPLGALSMPAMSRIDLVLARTMMVLSGIADQTSRVPGLASTSARMSAGTVVSRSVRKPGTVTGLFPFDDHDAWQRNAAHLRSLDALARRVKALEKKLGGGKYG